MPISINEASSATDLERIFRLRSCVLSDVDKPLALKNEGGAFDIFDTLPETSNFVATNEQQPIGALRTTRANAIDIPSQNHFDFIAYLDQHHIPLSQVLGLDWLYMHRDYNQQPGLLMGLLKMAIWHARRHHVRHLVAPVCPDKVKVIERLGGSRIAAAIESPVLGIPVVPMHVDLAALPPGVSESLQLPLQKLFLQSRERRIFRKGEIIERKGESAEKAYVIMRGAARTVRADPGQPRPFATALLKGPVPEYEFLFGPGELLGEFSVMSGKSQILTIVGHTREVDVMVLPRECLLRQLHGDSPRTISLAQLIGTRMRFALQENANVKPSVKLLALTLHDAGRNGLVSVDLNWLAAQTGSRIQHILPILEQWHQYVRFSSHDQVHIQDPEGLRRIADGVNGSGEVNSYDRDNHKEEYGLTMRNDTMTH